MLEDFVGDARAATDFMLSCQLQRDLPAVASWRAPPTVQSLDGMTELLLKLSARSADEESLSIVFLRLSLAFLTAKSPNEDPVTRL